MFTLRPRSFWDYLRSSFLAGVFVALPVAMTVVALIWIWDRMDGPLTWILNRTDRFGGSWEHMMEAIKKSDWGGLVPPLLGLAILIVAVLVLGMLVRSIVGRFFVRRIEDLVGRVPLVGFFYTAVKQLAEAFVDSKGKSKFKSAVLVQFPVEDCWVIGFVTGTAPEHLSQPLTQGGTHTAGEFITVFVPTTPLPTQGFTLLLNRAQVRELPISVEMAIKLVISGGIIAQPGNGGPPGPLTEIIRRATPTNLADPFPKTGDGQG